MPKQPSLSIVWRICFVVSGLSLWILIQLNSNLADLGLLPSLRTDKYNSNADLNLGYLVYTNGCRIPDFGVIDISIQKFFYDEKEIKCAERYGEALVESNLTAVYINESVLSSYNISDINELSCCYTPFWREQKKKSLSGLYPSDVDDNIRFAKTCIPFSGSATITEEFVRTECFLNSLSSAYNESIYTDFHAFTPVKNKTAKTHNLQNQNSVSVLILGVDAVSRMNLHRQMPLTLEFLKNNLSAVELLGYNKVGDNTFPNLVPVLSGYTVEELKEICWPSEKSVFDDCDFIWKKYRANEYTTAYSEDASWMSMFNYLKHGFRKQPTDYYLRPLDVLASETIGFEKRFNAKLCLGPRKSLEVLLGYAYKFAITMKEILTFSLVWGSSLSHDSLNLPKQGDKDHRSFLEKLYKQDIFNRTVLVFMSDHGLRWGSFRQTYQGYLEERLPFLYIAYPRWFGQKYTTAVGNLKRNTHKLTTPFDLHETLIDLVNLTRIEKEVLSQRSKELSNSQHLIRGISLFLPLSGSRTCEDAGIVDHWCTCHQSTSISTNNSQVQKAAKFLVKHITYLVQDYPRCAKLQLENIISAREEKATSHTKFNTSDTGITDYSLTIETVPGKALFEANIRYNGNNNKFILVGTVSRLNLYGDQSICVSSYRLRLYCYCI